MSYKGLRISILLLVLFACTHAQEKKVHGPNGKLQYSVKPINHHQFYINFYYESGVLEQEGVYTDIKHPKPEYNILWGTYRPCGENITYNENGLVVIECTYDSLSELHGTYKTFGPGKKMEKLVNYVHGKKHGLDLTYSNGKLLYNNSYQNGLKEGFCYMYDTEGGVDIKQYKKGKLDGVWMEKNNAEKIVEYHTYVNDTLNGLRYSADKDGKRTSECNYKKGKIEGEKVSYNLGTKTTCNYINGILEGVYTVHDENGILQRKSFYKGGLLEGESFSYENGKLVIKGFYRAGKKESVWIEYDYKDKTYERQLTYQNDKLITEGPWEVK